MIFHDRNAIFFHIGKAGGTSVELWLDGQLRDAHVLWGWNDDERIYSRHANIATTMRLVDPEILSTY